MAMFLRQPRFRFTVGFQDRLTPNLSAMLVNCKHWKFIFDCKIIINATNYVKYNYYCDVDDINNVTLRR